LSGRPITPANAIFWLGRRRSRGFDLPPDGIAPRKRPGGDALQTAAGAIGLGVLNVKRRRRRCVPFVQRWPVTIGKRALIALGAAVVLGFGGALAAPSAPEAGSDAALIDRALAYLQSLRAAEGRFSQTDSRGGASDGRFYFERPGKARFDYDGARGMLVVSDGDVVTVFDRRLKTTDQYPLEQTPLQLLLGEDVRLGRSVELESVLRRRKGFDLTLRAAKAAASGRLTLEFMEDPLRLAGWRIQDAQGGRTAVKLLSLERRSRLDPQLFTAGEPRAGAPHF